MSSPPHPYIDPARAATTRPPSPLDGLAAELSRSEGTRDIAVARSNPPDEVLEQMAHADAIHDRLRERGYQISFSLSADCSFLQIELRDVEGRLLRLLSADEAVEIAVGGTPG